MSKYEEMAQAAEEGRKNWIRRRDFSARFIYQLLLRFRQACEMPEERLQILPWDEKIGRFRDEIKPLTSVLGSTRYDIENDNWQACVCVYFNGANYLPRLYVTFVLFVTEHDYKFTVQIGEPGKPLPVDLNVQTQATQFFDTLTEAIEKAMKEPAKRDRVVVHGFAAPAAPEQAPII
jgi:hypothetical protein